VQQEWDAGRWPLWEPEENAGMPLLGNPTAAVLDPGKVVLAILPDPLVGSLIGPAAPFLGGAAARPDRGRDGSNDDR
jgi:hypothetical protein